MHELRHIRIFIITFLALLFVSRLTDALSAHWEFGRLGGHLKEHDERSLDRPRDRDVRLQITNGMEAIKKVRGAAVWDMVLVSSVACLYWREARMKQSTGVARTEPGQVS